jgi:tetratricopeptide (TPR) repeat protein
MPAPLLPAAPAWGALIAATLPPHRLGPFWACLGLGELPPGDGARAPRVAAAALAQVGPRALLQALRAAAPEAVVDLDRAAAELLPADARLGRLGPELVAPRVVEGRADAAEAALGALEAEGARACLVGPPGVGRRVLAAQIARLAVDRVPVVWWVEPAGPLGWDRALRRLIAALGGPVEPRAAARARAARWLAEVDGWLLIAPGGAAGLPELPGGRGRVLLTSEAPVAGYQSITVSMLTDHAAEAAVRRLAGRPAPGAAPRLPRALARWGGALREGWLGPGDAAPDPLDLAALLRRAPPPVQALAALLAAAAPAPLPLELLDGRIAPEALPEPLRLLARSPLERRDAARALGVVGLVDLTPHGPLPRLPADGAQAPVLAALLQAALLDGEVPLDLLLPHLLRCCDDPAMPAPLRRWLATEAGRRLDADGDPEGAVDWAQRALGAADGDPEVEARLLNDLALAWRHAGRPALGRRALEQALELDRPDRPLLPETRAGAWLHLGHLRADLGELEAALEAYEIARGLRVACAGPDDLEAGHASAGAARCCARLGRAGALRDHAELAVRSYERSRVRAVEPLAAALQLLAEGLLAAGDAAGARARLARAADLLEVHHGAASAEALGARRRLAALDPG